VCGYQLVILSVSLQASQNVTLTEKKRKKKKDNKKKEERKEKEKSINKICCQRIYNSYDF